MLLSLLFITLCSCHTLGKRSLPISPTSQELLVDLRVYDLLLLALYSDCPLVSASLL